jgi:hypothetical protein
VSRRQNASNAHMSARLITGQVTWKKWALKPSGLGVLSSANPLITDQASSSVNQTPNVERSREGRPSPSNFVQCECEGGVAKTSLKKMKAASDLSSSDSSVWSPCRSDRMSLCLRRALPWAWKKAVGECPSLIQRILDSRLAIVHCSEDMPSNLSFNSLRSATS